MYNITVLGWQLRFSTYITVSVMTSRTVYIHPERALHFDGVYLLTLSLGALLYLSFAVFSSGFQQTTGGAGKVAPGTLTSHSKKKSQDNHSATFSYTE